MAKKQARRKAKKGKRSVGRSSKSGKYVTKDYVKKHQSTTTTETDE